MSDVAVVAQLAEGIRAALQFERSYEFGKVPQIDPEFSLGSPHYLAVSHERMREISTEMCGLLDLQSNFLNSTRTLSAVSAEEVEAYAHRNDRLNQLSRELSEFD